MLTYYHQRLANSVSKRVIVRRASLVQLGADFAAALNSGWLRRGRVLSVASLGIRLQHPTSISNGIIITPILANFIANVP
jgi:hypothetical protein